MAEAIGCPLFFVDEFPVSEMERWGAYFSIQKDIKEGKPIITPDTITVESSQDNVIELFKRMASK